jgi:hypothetical protein
MKVTPLGGSAIDLGTTEAKPTISIEDYSERVTDDFGVTTVVRRGFSRRMSVRLGVPTGEIDALQRRLVDLRATSALWEADNRYDWLTVQGYYDSFTIDQPASSISFCSLTVLGLAETETVVELGSDPAPTGQASTLIMVDPVEITDAVLRSSTVPEDDAPVWAAGTTYAAGAKVIRAHRVFESIVGGNMGVDPTTDGTKWLDIRPANRWAMFDQALGTETTGNGSVVVTLRAGMVNAIALLDVIGDTVRVQAGAYDRTLPVNAEATTFLNMPLSDADVTVTIAGPGAVAVGTLLIGRRFALGVTEASPSTSITDYSLKETDAFGEVKVIERAWAKNMAPRAVLASSAVDIVANRIASVRGRPTLWIGDTTRTSLTTYGFFRDFSIEIGETVSILSLSIEGLSKTPPYVPPVVAWPDVTDPNGTKPTDNADKTSDNTSKDTSAVAGKPAQEVVDDLADIIDAYGGTIAAGQSAAAAAAARDAAQLAQQNSEAARDQAAAARSGAEGARGDALAAALAASGSAGAANTSASSASGSATAAGTSATAAQGSATAANSSAGAASVSAGQAATSATNASGSASSAATSSVTAASTYRRVIEATGNEQFANGIDGWLNADGFEVVPAAGGRSTLIRSVEGQARTIQGRKVPVNSADARFKLAAGWRCSAGSSRYYVGAIFYDGNDQPVTASDGTGNYPLGPAPVFTPASGWIDREIVIGKGVAAASPYGGTRAIPAAAVYFRPVMFINYDGSAGSLTEVDYFTVQDVTAEERAAGYASAASTSATSAAASETAAGQSASAASGSANTATTRAGEARTYRDDAATSASNAAGSASTASTQAGVASTSASNASGSATNAGNSASAAAGSASVASTKADQAGSSATAASNAKVAAEAARDSAVSSAGSASGSAASASGSASSALDYRNTTATYRDQAAGSASAANLSAQSASSSAASVDANVGAISQQVNRVEAKADNAVATAGQSAEAIATLNGYAASRVVLQAVSPGGRAQLSLYSSSNGGAGADLVGDLRIDGNLTVDGTITTSKIAANAVNNGASVVGGSRPFTTSYTLVAQVNYTPASAGSTLIVFASGVPIISPGAPAGTYATLLVAVNGTVLVNTTVGGRTIRTPFTFILPVSGLSGTLNFQMTIGASAGNGGDDPHVIDRPTLVIMEQKR